MDGTGRGFLQPRARESLQLQQFPFLRNSVAVCALAIWLFAVFSLTAAQRRNFMVAVSLPGGGHPTAQLAPHFSRPSSHTLTLLASQLAAGEDFLEAVILPEGLGLLPMGDRLVSATNAGLLGAAVGAVGPGEFEFFDVFGQEVDDVLLGGGGELSFEVGFGVGLSGREEEFAGVLELIAFEFDGFVDFVGVAGVFFIVFRGDDVDGNGQAFEGFQEG